MLKKVPYIQGRPYIEIIFIQPGTDKQLLSVFAILDSGADTSHIPYKLGVEAGFADPDANEMKGLQPVSGIVGSITTLIRDCDIALKSSDGKKLFVFKTTVGWVHPDQASLDEAEQCYREASQLESILQGKNIDQAVIEKIQKLIEKKRERLGELAKHYNGGLVLLGRNFFCNFEHVQFVQKDNLNDCKYIYKVKANKIDREIVLSN